MRGGKIALILSSTQSMESLMISRRHFLLSTLAVPAAGLIATPALAMTPEVFAVDGLAIRGYDPGSTVWIEYFRLCWNGETTFFQTEKSFSTYRSTYLATDCGT